MLTRSTATNRSAGLRARLSRRTQRAFTLAEVMMATVVFTMGILGVYTMMIKSYELVTLSRHRDNARALLVSFCDQFLRLQTTEANPIVGQPPILRALFSTAGPAGAGLTWTDSRGVSYNGNGVDNTSLKVMLGQTNSSQVEATVTREVTFLDSAGQPAAGPTATAAGWILQATFTIEYPVSGKIQRQSITVARSVK